MRGLKWAAALMFVLAASDGAWAGWEIDQKSYNLRASGQEIGRTSVRLLVSKDRVRMADGKVVTLFDYKKDRLALLLPAKKMFWDGTSDEYLTAVRRINTKTRLAQGEMEKLPKMAVQIEAKPETIEIAGKVAKKYAIVLDGYPFQDVWITDSFGIEKDLDSERFQAMQLKLAQSTRSNYGMAMTVLQKNPLYQDIVRKGFAMRTNSYLGEAIMGTEIVRVAPREVPDSDFDIPKEYKRATLLQLIDAQKADLPQNPPPKAEPQKAEPKKPKGTAPAK